MVIDPKLYYRRAVMTLLEDDNIFITDGGDHIIYERDFEKAVFKLTESKLEYLLQNEVVATYDVGRAFLMIALKRSLVEYYLK